MFKEKRNPFFNVRKEKLVTESGIELSKVAIINDETDDVLGVVSPSYEMVPNKDIATLFEEATKGIAVFSVDDHLDSTTRRWRRRMVFEKNAFEVLPGDSIGIMLEIFNGYDARTSFGYNLMGYRYICENGMVMGKKDLFGESYVHYENSPRELRNSFEMKFDLFNENGKLWKKWTEIPFPQSEFSNFVSSRDYLGDKVKEAIVASYEPVMNHEKLEENKYGAFNVLTYLSTHTTKARKGSNIFSNRYRSINRMAGDMYSYEPKKNLEVVVG